MLSNMVVMETQEESSPCIEISDIKYETFTVRNDNWVAPCKRIQDILVFWILGYGFRIPGTGFQSVELGFWIPIVIGIPDS